MTLPNTHEEALRCITTETARMSYPASMSRGIKPIVAQHTKKEVEAYFVTNFPINDIWDSKSRALRDFDAWHAEQVHALAAKIKSKVLYGNQPSAVAAKFINTFLHQLTKYETARPLVPLLHVPLDSRVFAKLRTLKSPALISFKAELKGSPNKLEYIRHQEIQQALLLVLSELNKRKGAI